MRVKEPINMAAINMAAAKTSVNKDENKNN